MQQLSTHLKAHCGTFTEIYWHNKTITAFILMKAYSILYCHGIDGRNNIKKERKIQKNSIMNDIIFLIVCDKKI